MAKSGNRPPRGGQPKTGGGQPKSSNGNRPPRTERTTPTPANAARTESASERARERLAQQNLSGQRRQTASQRARAGGPSTQRARSGGPASRRGSSRSAQKHSTAKTAGIFGAALVVLAVLVIVLVSVVGKSPSSGQVFGTQTAPAAVVNAVNHTPASAFAQAGSTITSAGPFTSGIYKLKGLAKLTQGGKPLIVYVGSEWCPYCAATRWPLALALARFGTFTGLHTTESSLTDVYPRTPSLSFYGTTYTSRYIAFSPTEQCTDIPSKSTSAAVQGCNGYEPLMTWTPAIAKLFLKYDYPPYVPATGNFPGGIPFIDFANQFHEDGAFISPTAIQGYNHLQIAQSLGNPAASPAQPILVGANYYSAMICKLTNNQPGSVCQMPAVKQAGTQLKL